MKLKKSFKIMLMALTVFSAAICEIANPVTAEAVLIEFQYLGNQFDAGLNYFIENQSYGNKVSGQVIFDLPNNTYTGTADYEWAKSYSFTAGSFTLTQDNSLWSPEFEFINGQILAWHCAPTMYYSSDDGLIIETTGNPRPWWGNAQEVDRVMMFDYDSQYFGGNGVYDYPGVWTAQTPAVPIPGAVWLLGSGLVLLVGVKRFRNS